MKSACSNCDLGLKRANCSDLEYVECECRRWMTQQLKASNFNIFMHVLDEVLEEVYENKSDLKNNKLRMIEYLSRGLIE